MDIESAYEQMWATDVAAMSGYHADASAAADQLAPWQHVMQNLGVHFSNGNLTFGPHAATGNLAHHLSGMTGLDHTGGHVGSWLTDTPGDRVRQRRARTRACSASSHYVTGGMGAANVHSGLLSSPTAGTGFNPGTTNPGLLSDLGSGAIPTGSPD